MSAYESFARVYDELMDQVPYDTWCTFIQEELAQHGITGGLSLELGCGTGKMMERMAAAGFDMIGVDSSMDMLQIAMEKSQDLPYSLLYLLQDMREFELYGTVESIVSICDSVNYITEPEDLLEVFRLVNNYLDPGGIFLFDFNTEHKYRDSIGERTIAEDREDVSFIWYNEYDEEEHLNYIDLNVFVREEEDLFRKYQEEHVQRGYTLSEMKELIENSGLVFLAAYDDYTKKPATKESERIVIVAREQGKGEQ
ncbi:MAG: class I SAM-dependent methyltransferase [Eubacteriales bacterium]|nr:class I SAM-dependent methyltransferase [Eubacteriales bacterium]